MMICEACTVHAAAYKGFAYHTQINFFTSQHYANLQCLDNLTIRLQSTHYYVSLKKLNIFLRHLLCSSMSLQLIVIITK